MKKSLKVLALVCSIAFFLGLSACSNVSDSVSGENSVQRQTLQQLVEKILVHTQLRRL